MFEKVHREIIVTGHSFYFTCSPSLSTSAPPFTVDNILTAIQGVNWRTLDEVLRYIYSVDDDYTNVCDDDLHHAVATALFQSEEMYMYKERSWRHLIWRLDHHDMIGVADNIRQYAETVLG